MLQSMWFLAPIIRSALKHTHTMTTIANTMRIAAPTVAACSSSRSITQQAGTLPSKGRPAHQAPRKGARGSTTRSALMANRPQEVGNDTYDTYGTVEQALAAACLSLGRPFGEPEQALVARLRANWYTHATDLVAMDTEQAAALQVPLRLLKHIQQQQLGSNNIIPSNLPSFIDPTTSEDLADTETHSTTAATTAQCHQPSSSSPGMAGSSSTSNTHSGIGATTAPTPAPTPALPQGTLEQWVQEIQQRRAPPANRFGFGSQNRAASVRIRQIKRQAYSIKPDELPPSAAQHLERFHSFLTVPFYGAQSLPIAQVTAVKLNHHVRMMLGWLHYVRGVPKGALTLEALVPSSEREGVKVFFDYCQWLTNDRQVNSRTLTIAARALNHLSRFLYHEHSTVRPGSGVLAYSDIPVVQEMRALQNMYRKQTKVEPRATDESKKFVEWPEFLWAVDELKRECAGYEHNGRHRSPSAVAWALQRYLIFAILSCVPDRQRTIRELRVGTTLVKSSENGKWYIRHGPSDYKTGKTYGPRPAMLLAPQLYPELEAFMHVWRQHLHPQHDYLFSSTVGKPLTEQSLHRLFTSTTYRLLGRKLNPHLVRDSVVTYFRERQLEALALYMGHSLKEQRETYDRRTLAQKVEPAIELLADMTLRKPT